MVMDHAEDHSVCADFTVQDSLSSVMGFVSGGLSLVYRQHARLRDLLLIAAGLALCRVRALSRAIWWQWPKFALSRGARLDCINADRACQARSTARPEGHCIWPIGKSDDPAPSGRQAHAKASAFPLWQFMRPVRMFSVSPCQLIATERALLCV